MALPTIEIQPAGSGTVTAIRVPDREIHHSDQYGTLNYTTYNLSATPANGWEFDHFESTVLYVDKEGLNPPVTIVHTSNNNPAESIYEVFLGAEYGPPTDTIFPQGYGVGNVIRVQEVDNDWFGPPTSGGRYRYVNTISVTKLVAVFKSSTPPGTGLILYNEDGNIIYCQRAPRWVVYDDGTQDPI